MLDKLDINKEIAEMMNIGDEQIAIGCYAEEYDFPITPSVCQFCGEDLNISIFNVGEVQKVVLECNCKGWRDFTEELING